MTEELLDDAYYAKRAAREERAQKRRARKNVRMVSSLHAGLAEANREISQMQKRIDELEAILDAGGRRRER